MGYYVHIVNSTARIPFDKMFDACKKIEAWYDNKMVAGKVFEDVGFETQVESNGDLSIVYYDGKSRDEQAFLDSIAEFIEGEMEWVGEEGERWRTVYRLGKLPQHQTPTITWN